MSTHLKALAKRTNPKTISVFPLKGSMLLSGCELPLNIFEPRYLNMIDDALKTDRLIGMLQPLADAHENPQQSEMNTVGGLGRIVQFAETEDGRYMVVLKGLKRFRMIETADMPTPYLQAHISFDEFQNDIDVHDKVTMPEAFNTEKSERSALIMAMKSYAKTLGVQLDWNSMKEIGLNRLVDQAAMISPFGVEDKQSLLEAKTHSERRRLLIGLMHLHSDTDLYSQSSSNDDNGPTLQ
ncbi:MAG: hypothetical protein COA43_05560 [Robiginitomaculum sp.]|nr:MAG: hypothetical protein COA43_05560 [Robiginitomaculum sp.]